MVLILKIYLIQKTVKKILTFYKYRKTKVFITWRGQTIKFASMFDPKGWKFVKNQRGNIEHHPLINVLEQQYKEANENLSCVELQVQ